MLGIIATRQLSFSSNTEGGRGLARWAVIVGALGTTLQAAFFITWLTLFITLLTSHPTG